MTFNSLIFVLFFGAVLLLSITVRHNTFRKRMLLLGSYYFYAYWDWRFCGLLLISTLVDYTVGLLLARTDAPKKRALLLLVSLVCNLGLLGFFKYYNFFVASLAAALEPLGWDMQGLNIILPVGISFYTFQTLSYTIDVYRRRIDTCRDFFDFALFVAFFPQLVAGPIVRASDFLPQLQAAPRVTLQRIHSGLRQFIFGMFKKVVIADHLAMMVDMVYPNLTAFDTPTVWLATAAYAAQIYCDFSGYSDMAIGVARMMGYDFNRNFDHPYLARSTTEFWRRWHISLSTWLRDYLYIPLGGNRKGPRRTYINLMLTMLLGGLWHGASWAFVLWGLLHGAALAAHKFLSGRFLPRFHHTVARGIWSFIGWTVTMTIVMVAWVFFRCGSLTIAGQATMSESFALALDGISAMFHWREGIGWIMPQALLGVGFVVLTHLMELHPAGRRLKRLPALSLAEPTLLCTLVWMIIVFYPENFAPFIYFQF
ncbi:MAG: MBOAT family protein [Phycisphaerae bacterium]|nr:MBOAT family protein [Phycisphaerae bacterium]